MLIFSNFFMAILPSTVTVTSIREHWTAVISGLVCLLLLKNLTHPVCRPFLYSHIWASELKFPRAVENRELKHRRRTGRRRRFIPEKDWTEGFVYGGKTEVKQTRPFGESTALPLTIVLVCLWRSKTFAICL